MTQVVICDFVIDIKFQNDCVIIPFSFPFIIIININYYLKALS